MPLARRALLSAAAALVPAALLAPMALAKPRVTTDMFGQRYCEYLAVKGTSPNLTADVWNTYGLNKCPDAQWRASDASSIAAELGAVGVLLNGPRYWLVDRNSIELKPPFGKVRLFSSSGLELRFLATVKIPTVNGVPNRAPYNETTVRRSNTFTWTRDHRVYELLAPGGRVYIMQAYSQIVDRKLTLKKLPKLGSRLELPDGWRFRTRQPTKDVSLTPNGKAVVIQDDLQNTYQLLRGK